MADGKCIDFTKLLGFKTVSEQISKGLDLQDETVAAKLGAKVGGDIDPAAAPVRMADNRGHSD